jgi:hypothetical protein
MAAPHQIGEKGRRTRENAPILEVTLEKMQGIPEL